MLTVKLGRTGLVVNKNGFGALPIQRIPLKDAVYLLQKAYDNGITYFDTARAYSDSEEKMGAAVGGFRDKIVIATKTASTTPEGFRKDLETSLRLMKTDYIDVYQFHNPKFCPKPDDGSGLYEEMLRAKEEGKIRFIALTNHAQATAMEAVRSGLYDLVQYPFSYLASPLDEEVVKACKEENVGFVAMKGMSGGLIRSGRTAYAYIAQYDNVLPIWGVQRETELDDFLSCQIDPPVLDAEMQAVIDADRAELCGDFCRACGYCMPCPVGIEINTCARMSLLLRRAPYAGFLTPDSQEMMKKIEDCLHCGQCSSKCPYGLDTPALLQKNYEDYRQFAKEH